MPKLKVFDACKLQGLTGKQGVIIPRQNMQHLMLRKDVTIAVEEGQFHIHAIDTIDQALEILMARPVGTLDKKVAIAKFNLCRSNGTAGLLASD